jgi:nucleoside-diphosphate-sugar epimerase
MPGISGGIVRETSRAGPSMAGSTEWRGRRVLVTGADGFLGSHLVERLLAHGAVVAALVRPSSVSGTVGFRLRNLAPVQAALAAVIAADVASPDCTDRIVEWRPQVVYHLAADAYVERSFAHPREVMRTNLGGTESVLAAMRRAPEIERLVVTSSSEIYGGTRGDSIDEDHPLEPSSPYAASKVAADRLAYAHHRTYGTPVAIVRPFNTFGPRHPYDVIPKFVARALRGDPLVVHGDGTQSRDFTYVDDMVDAFVMMGSHPEAIGRAVNFGTGHAVEIARIARLVVEIAASSSPIEHGPPRAAEVARLCCDATLAARMFGWRSRVTLEEGLHRYVAWAREADAG